MSTIQVTRRDLNPCTVQLDIVCGPEQVKDGYERAIKSLGKKVKVPGFRPGHTPRQIVEQIVDAESLKNEATEEIVRRAYSQALKEQEIKPHDLPDVSLTNMDETTCEFVAKIPLAPIVELGDYKGIEVSKPPADVTDEEVEQQIAQMRERLGTSEKITNRGVELGDVAVLNVKVDGEEGDGRNFMSEVGRTFPGLDDALKGMRVEEMKALDLEFPDSFQERDWAGKKLHCTLTVRSLNSRRLPELDDEFAQKLKTENLGDLKVKLRAAIANAKEQMAQDFVNEKIQEEILRRSTVHVPDNMWEKVAVQRLNELGREVQERGQTVEDYAKANGMTVDQLVEGWKQEARTHVMRAVVIREIFVKEKLKLTNQDVNRELVAMANEMEMKPEELMAALRKSNGFRELEFRAIFKVVVKFLNENAKVVPEPARV